MSNEPLLSALRRQHVLLGLLTVSIGRLSGEPPACCQVPSRTTAVAGGTTDAAPAAADPGDPFATDHVARLGAELFGRHLLAVEAAGVLLLVAALRRLDRDGVAACRSRMPRRQEGHGMTLLPLVHDGLLVGAILFALGLVGILARRDLIVMFLCAD